ALVINPVLIALMARMSNKGVKILATVIAAIGLIITFKLDAGAGNMLVFIGVFILINPRFISPTTTRFQESFLPKLENRYKLFLSYALTRFRPIWILLGVIGLFGASIGLLKVLPPKVVFFPANEPAYLNVFIEKPIGTDIKVTDSDAKMIEEKVINFFNRVPGTYTKTLSDGSKEQVIFENDSLMFLVKSIITQVGNGTSDPANGPSMANTPEKARVQVSFVEYVDRQGVLTSDIMNSVREEVSGNPGVSVVVDKDPAGPPMGKPINIEIAGDNYEKLVNESEKMLQFIKNSNVEGVEELKMNIETSKPELIINIDAQKARRLNMSTAQIGMTIRTALFGKEVSKFKQGEDEYDITVRLNEYTRNNIDNLMNQRITFRDMLTGKIRQVPISAVATVGKSSTISSVKRIDLKRTISLQSNVLDDYNPNEVVAALKKVLEEYEISNGLTWNFTGQQEEQAKELEFLVVALGIAIFLILLIIVAQFNSISAPAIILFAVLLSFTGVFTGLIMARMEFVIIMMMIGIISLAGVVVNNAIVLVDYTKLLITRKELELGISGERADKLPVHLVKQAIVDGGKTRLRPVILTAITTILGLLPMATGLNIDFFGLFGSFDANISVGGDNVIFWGPMAWTIIFGLSFATFLTLVIVPVMFYLTLRLKYKALGIK
ncbi:MAG: multidrug efflux pump, partial [Glaciecola sp.]